MLKASGAKRALEKATSVYVDDENEILEHTDSDWQWGAPSGKCYPRAQWPAALIAWLERVSSEDDCVGSVGKLRFRWLVPKAKPYEAITLISWLAVPMLGGGFVRSAVCATGFDFILGLMGVLSSVCVIVPFFIKDKTYILYPTDSFRMIDDTVNKEIVIEIPYKGKWYKIGEVSYTESIEPAPLELVKNVYRRYSQLRNEEVRVVKVLKKIDTSPVIYEGSL